MKIEFSVVIPLYNKRAEIGDTLRSVLSQSYAPKEIIVVDDGSTDGGGDIVMQIAADNPTIKIVRQANAGVSVARNRGVEESSGSHISLLDADDTWVENYLFEVAGMIVEYPDCGVYCTGFRVKRRDGIFDNDDVVERGLVDNFFDLAMHHNIIHTSSVTIPRSVFDATGGFPAGMKLGEDLYLWTKIASDYRVCYTPDKLSLFNLTASNRSAQRYKIEHTAYTFKDFYDPSFPARNEYIARCEIGKSIVHSVNGYTLEASDSEHFYRYTERYRRGLLRLKLLNRLPVTFRPAFNRLYIRLAWVLAGRGKFEG